MLPKTLLTVLSPGVCRHAKCKRTDTHNYLCSRFVRHGLQVLQVKHSYAGVQDPLQVIHMEQIRTPNGAMPQAKSIKERERAFGLRVSPYGSVDLQEQE